MDIEFKMDENWRGCAKIFVPSISAVQKPKMAPVNFIPQIYSMLLGSATQHLQFVS